MVIATTRIVLAQNKTIFTMFKMCSFGKHQGPTIEFDIFTVFTDNKYF